MSSQNNFLLNERNRVVTLLHRQCMLDLLPWCLTLVILSSLGGIYSELFSPLIWLWGSFFLLIMVGVVVYALMSFVKIKERVTLTAVVEHYNACVPMFEQSLQLLLQDKTELNPLQQLQYEKVRKLTNRFVASEQVLSYGPQLSFIQMKRQFLVAAAAVAIVLGFTLFIHDRSDIGSAEIEYRPITSTASSQLLAVDISIVPPSYSQLPERQQSDFAMSVLAGSQVFWRLRFDHLAQESSLYLVLGSGKKVPFVLQDNGDYLASAVITNTLLYQVEQQPVTVSDSDELTEFFSSDLHAITVTEDKKPSIKIISPKPTITELTQTDDKKLTTKVLISDDFALDKVQIIASIAKGSGEAVKFRDQIFQFDQSYLGLNGDEFLKSFDLPALGMAPGDELYFSIHAWDNKLPQPQRTRSVTKIIRWLEDGELVVMADGILIDFMPEYFKSQRQIIIETKELIADQETLSRETFIETSELLGVAQSELKEKYGQYLGDESESGGLHQHQADHDEHHMDESHSDEHGEDTHHEEMKAAPVGHEDFTDPSDDFDMQGFSIDRSGLTEEMQKFGHNHGEADIGIMAKQDPKALMKRSLANMWQAELHLMLSEPEKALPYEEEALKYLKMAKKADRIYVKRLGFEPPPVSEQRRYQGELDDILSYQRQETLESGMSDNQVYISLYNRLDELELASNKQLNWLARDKELLTQVKALLSDKLSSRPSLIDSILTIEKLLRAESFQLAQCVNCLASLKEKLWQLIDLAPAQPSKATTYFSNDNHWLKAYRQYLNQQERQRWN